LRVPRACRSNWGTRIQVLGDTSGAHAVLVVAGKIMTARWLLRAAANDLQRVDSCVHPRAIVRKIDRLVQMINEFDKYLDLDQGAMPNYAERYGSGLPVSSSRADSTANALVNRRFNKRRQMRWSPKGAQRVLQARVAILDGRLRNGCLKLIA
jgi:hypothetical protein